jgi:hypothetical protein
MTKVRINKQQKLFVIPEAGGFTCLGFDVCFERSTKLATELGLTVPMKSRKATRGAYEYYAHLCNVAREKHTQTGWRSQSELTPELIGLEGKRVEVVTEWGETKRFYVGKSTGYIPCHLEIARSNSTGGPAIIGKIKSVKVIR